MNLFRSSIPLAVFIASVSSGLRSPSAPVPSIAIGQNFDGSRFAANTQFTPADSNGAIGPAYFAEFINGSFAVYNKTNGQPVKRVSDLHFWSNAGVVLSSGDGVTDPRIVYDPTVQRWFASMVDYDFNAVQAGLDYFSEANDFLLAVSATSDPRGTWHGFLFAADPDTGYFADFPTLGIDSNAVYLSGNLFQSQDVSIGPALWSFPKADLVAAAPTIANATWFGGMDYAERGEVLQPANCFDGSTSGKVLSITDIGNDSAPHSNLVSFAVQNAGNPNASLTASTFIQTLAWVVPDNDILGAPVFAASQPDGTTTLQANDARLCAKVYAASGYLYAVHNTELNGRIAIRWYRLRASDNILLESGTLADPALDLFYPSIAANANGVVVIAYNGSGPATTISSFAMAGQTISGVTTFGNPILLQAGVVSYHDLNEQFVNEFEDLQALSRWGDYSTTSLDPSDPNRFWTIQMYPADSANNYVWSTRITELITVSVPLLAIKKTGTNVTVSWPTGLTGYQLQAATNLVSSITWSNITQIPQTNGAQVSVLLPASPGCQFFRLKK